MKIKTTYRHKLLLYWTITIAILSWSRKALFGTILQKKEIWRYVLRRINSQQLNLLHSPYVTIWGHNTIWDWKTTRSVHLRNDLLVVGCVAVHWTSYCFWNSFLLLGRKTYFEAVQTLISCSSILLNLWLYLIL